MGNDILNHQLYGAMQVMPLNSFRSQTLLNLAGMLGWQKVGDAVPVMVRAVPSMAQQLTSGISQVLAGLNGLLLLGGETSAFWTAGSREVNATLVSKTA